MHAKQEGGGEGKGEGRKGAEFSKVVQGTYRGQLQAMTSGQFDKTPKTNSVI